MVHTKTKRIFQLFLTFLKIGAFTFGGGYAMIPLIQREVVDRKKWITEEDILDIVAIAESTPGPIAINSATFVGYRVAGFFGALAATLGVVLPSFAIILAISYMLQEFHHILVVQYAFMGIRSGVLALILKAMWSMYKQCPKDPAAYLIAALSFVLSAFAELDVLYIIFACALCGLIISTVRARRRAA